MSTTPEQNQCPAPHTAAVHHEPADPTFLMGQMWGILSGIPAQLEHIQQTARDNHAAVMDRVRTNEKEIASVKNRQYWFSGAVAAAGVFIGFAAGHLGIKL